MKYTVTKEFLLEKEYLIVLGFVELYGSTPDAYAAQERVTAGWAADGSAERLRRAAGADEVYLLFCRTCRLYESTGGYICGHELACENVNHRRAGDGFDAVRLDACEHAVFDCSFDCEMTRVQAYKTIDGLYWDGWLRDNPYQSMIDGEYANDPGTAAVTLADPFYPCAETFRIKTWYPIRRKEV